MPPVTVPVATSYFQYDQQGVVFNMWYFGWFDDAMTQFLATSTYPYPVMNADGLDVQGAHRGRLARCATASRWWST